MMGLRAGEFAAKGPGAPGGGLTARGDRGRGLEPVSSLRRTSSFGAPFDVNGDGKLMTLLRKGSEK